MDDGRDFVAARCPGCGGAVPYDGCAPQVVCRYCGRTIDVHAQDRLAHEQLADSALLEQEAQAALGLAADAEARARARAISLAAAGVALAPAIALAFLLHYAGHLLVPETQLALQAAQVLSAAIGLPVSGLVALLHGSPQSVRNRAARRLAHMSQHVEHRAPGGRCPGCGATVQASGRVATFPCTFCGIPLAYARGVLIEWSKDARARAKRWTEYARAETFRVVFWPWYAWVGFSSLLVGGACVLQSALILLGKLL